jgi:lactate dehydrogenase-like 2-hydroxyacid dehydrogenase
MKQRNDDTLMHSTGQVSCALPTTWQSRSIMVMDRLSTMEGGMVITGVEDDKEIQQRID